MQDFNSLRHQETSARMRKNEQLLNPVLVGVMPELTLETPSKEWQKASLSWNSPTPTPVCCDSAVCGFFLQLTLLQDPCAEVLGRQALPVGMAGWQGQLGSQGWVWLGCWVGVAVLGQLEKD